MKPHIFKRNGAWIVQTIGVIDVFNHPPSVAACDFVRRQLFLGLW